MRDVRVRFEQAVSEFRTWADSYPHAERFGEWECGYDHWVEIGGAFSAFLEAYDPRQWDQPIVELLFYILARDNEAEVLKGELVGRPRHLLALARAGVASTEQHARWQLADALGSIDADEKDIVRLLEAYAADADEYVSRRALLALGRRQAPVAEALARRAWDTDHEYQRMAALDVLCTLNSPLLPSYLEVAEQDGRQYLVSLARRIRSKPPALLVGTTRG